MIQHSGLGPIGILGAGGHARELADYCGREIRFFAVSPAFLSARETNDSLVSLESPSSEIRDSEVVVGVGAPGLKRLLINQWPGIRFATVCAERSYLAQSASIAQGTVLAPFAAVMARAVVGAHVLLNTAASVSHDCTVGDFATLSPGARIGGGCVIGRGAFIGIGATVKEGVRVGDGAVIGAGAVVIADVIEREVVAGVPARRLRIADDWMREF